MNDFIYLFEIVKESNDYYILSLIVCSLMVSTVDWFFGWTNAKFNKKVVFVSGLALHGIIKKMKYFILIIVFVIVSLLVLPNVIAIPSIISLLIGYIISELNSVLSHLGLTEDGKKGDLFITFFKRLVNGKDERK